MVHSSFEFSSIRTLMAVTVMTDCGRWVFVGPQRQGFSFDPRTRQKIDFTQTPGGWDLTMKLEPPERANKMLNKAIQEISAKKRAAEESRDNGAITGTDGLVRIMGCDPFRRPDFFFRSTASNPASRDIVAMFWSSDLFDLADRSPVATGSLGVLRCTSERNHEHV